MELSFHCLEKPTEEIQEDDAEFQQLEQQTNLLIQNYLQLKKQQFGMGFTNINDEPKLERVSYLKQFSNNNIEKKQEQSQKKIHPIENLRKQSLKVDNFQEWQIQSQLEKTEEIQQQHSQAQNQQKEFKRKKKTLKKFSRAKSAKKKQVIKQINQLSTVKKIQESTVTLQKRLLQEEDEKLEENYNIYPPKTKLCLDNISQEIAG